MAPLDPKPDPCIVLQRVWRRRISSTSISRLEIELRPKLVQSIIWENFPPNKTVYKEKNMVFQKVGGGGEVKYIGTPEWKVEKFTNIVIYHQFKDELHSKF